MFFRLALTERVDLLGKDLSSKQTSYDLNFQNLFSVKLNAYRDIRNMIRLNEVINFNNRINIYQKPFKYSFIEVNQVS